MADIFISYIKKDRSRIEPLAKALEEQGRTVWWDPIIPTGKDFDEVIEEELSKARCVIVIWTKRSVKSKYVKGEAREALNRDILIPIEIESGIKPPFDFRSIQTLSLNNWDGSDSFPGFQKLIADIVNILGDPPVEAEKRKREQAEREAEKERRRKQEEENKRREEEQRKPEKELKFDQKLAKKAKSKPIDTEKTDFSRLDTDKEEDKLIAVGHTRELWLPILLTSIGWAIGWSIGWTIGWPIGYAIGGAISGLITTIALRQIVPSIQFKQVLYVSFGWTIGLTIGGAITRQVWYTIVGAAIGGAIGGFITIIALRQIIPNIQLKQVLGTTFGWTLGWAIGWFIGVHFGIAIGGVIGGAIGGGVMSLLLAQTKQST